MICGILQSLLYLNLNSNWMNQGTKKHLGKFQYTSVACYPLVV